MNEAAATDQKSFSAVVWSWRQWWRTAVVATVNQTAVIEKRRAECELTGRYLLMLAMSAGIAVLGLLLSSPAVVIGAMLLSPLMDPIMGLGFGLAIGDFEWTKKSAKSLFIGSAFAVVLCALVVFLSPLQTVTSEIAARTRPNLFDLLVALFSAIAGAYAMIRGREGTVVGVAIATALMPPLAVVGFGLATWNGAVFWGALLLFVTNLLTIALTAWAMAKLYGFRTSTSESHTLFQSVVIGVIFIGLTIPLFLSLQQIVWESRSAQKIRQEVMDPFPNHSKLSGIDINWDAEPIQISATVFTPELEPDAEAEAGRAIEREIGRAVEISIIQSRVGPDEDAAEEAQLAAARAQQEAAQRRVAEELATRLALVAGVTERDVLVDRERRAAFVVAKPLEGATLAAYRELEDRIVRTEPEWTIRLRPPARPMPPIGWAGGKITDSGVDALDLIEWAAVRINATVQLSGPADAVDYVARQLANSGVSVTKLPDTNGGDQVTASWGAPSS